MLRSALIFGTILVAFDAAAAAISKAAVINYGNFLLPATLLYVAFGIYAGQRLARWRALAAIVLAAAIDLFVGNYAALLLGPGRATSGPWTREFTGTAVMIAVADVVFGAIGIAVGLRVASRVR
jgi:hypothetical protein